MPFYLQSDEVREGWGNFFEPGVRLSSSRFSEEEYKKKAYLDREIELLSSRRSRDIECTLVPIYTKLCFFVSVAVVAHGTCGAQAAWHKRASEKGSLF